jgi:hypothetical protein
MSDTGGWDFVTISRFGKLSVLSYVYDEAVSHRLPTVVALVRAQASHVGFVMDKMALDQVLSEYFGFPYQFSFHRLFHIHHHHLSFGASTIGQLVADVPNGLSLTSLQETKKNYVCDRQCSQQRTTAFNSHQASRNVGRLGKPRALSLQCDEACQYF